MKVLIVEDEKTTREYLQKLLLSKSYECKIAANGQEALVIHDQFDPDIIISDIQMPTMSGLEMLEKIRTKKSDTIVIMTTAHSLEDNTIQALRLGANNYLKKPIQDDDILNILKKYESILEQAHDANKYGKTIKRSLFLEFKTTHKNIPRIVERLIYEIQDIFDDTEKINIELGLLELITNAVEHGNLEISYDEKNEALHNNNFELLCNKRLADNKFANRKITVQYEYDLLSCEWTITDEGKGFNWEEIPNPTNDSNLLELNGRGIFITRFLFDELEYKGKGNIVRVKKYI